MPTLKMSRGYFNQSCHVFCALDYVSMDLQIHPFNAGDQVVLLLERGDRAQVVCCVLTDKGEAASMFGYV